MSDSVFRRWFFRRLPAIAFLAIAGIGLTLWKLSSSCAVEIGSGPMVGFQLNRDSLIEIQLPGSSRERAEGPVPITGPWVISTTHSGVRTWEAPLPVRPRTLFFHRAPDDMTVLQRTDASKSGWETARKLTHRTGVAASSHEASWTFSSHTVQVRRPIESGPPSPGEYGVRYTRAVERENSLNLDYSGMEDVDFIFRSLQVDDTTRSGILLPAPAMARFEIQVPEGGALEFDSILIPPEASDPAIQSDGAVLRLTLEVDGESEELLEIEPRLGHADTHQVDLSEWGGEIVHIRIESEPGETADLDYVFLADPVVFTPTTQPKRVAVIFIDTLRPDHMSLYGANRSTTPGIDAWAEDAAVFENARSIAPWTLPSTRSMLTGHIPERWGQVPTFHSELAKQGWATSFVAGNVYLSSNFDMSSDWSEHRCINWPKASVQVDRALDFLNSNPNRDAFVVLHLMDMHLPYTEPKKYKGRFAGTRPDTLSKDDFHRSEVMKMDKSDKDRQYVRDRYDQNLAYIDDQLGRFLQVLPEDATVIILSDHGEEFWDHGGFEHGHTLYDELIRIPMVVRSPGVTPGRYSEPVSMIDVAPTLATAVGLDTEDMLGWPLQNLADGSQSEEFQARPQAFGRPLYGLRRWGALLGDQKYTVYQGKESLYDLSSDPVEEKNLLRENYAPDAMIEAMSKALDRPVELGFRLIPPKSSAKAKLVINLQVPGGIKHIVIAEDPLNSSEVTTTLSADGESLEATWKGGERGTREVFIVPNRPVEEVASEISMKARRGQDQGEATPDDLRYGASPRDGKGGEVVRIKLNGAMIKLTHAVVPIPPSGEEGLDATDKEVQADLEALGYIED